MLNTKIPLYGIFIMLSIILGIIEICMNLKKIEKEKESILILAAYIFVSSVFGAKYLTYILNYKELGPKFNFFEIGMSSYGAVLGIIVIVFVYCKQFKKDYKKIFNIVIPSIPLMYSIGKIGCFLAGCCHGIEYSGILSVTYNYSYIAPSGIKLFPVQLIEAIVFFMIYIFLKTKKENRLIMCFVLCGLSKFILDYFRISHKEVILSSNQIISLLFIITGILLMIIGKNKKRKKVFAFVNKN